MTFKTRSGFVTVFVGEKSIRVDTRDQRLYEQEFIGMTESIEGETAHLHIYNHSEVFIHAAQEIGLINDGPEPPKSSVPRILHFGRLSVKLPDGKTKVITRPNHPRVFNLLQYTINIEAPAIAIRVQLNNDTAAWYGRVYLMPYKPPVEQPAVEPPRSTPAVETYTGQSTSDSDSSNELEEEVNENLFKCVEELELSVRTANCLKNNGIEFIYELCKKTENEMLRTKNFGRKSLNEIKELLAELGLSLGMNLPDHPRLPR